MECSAVTLPLEPRSSSADFAENPLEEKNIHAKNEVVTFMDDGANHENVINEVQNQKEDENNQVHAGFFADDPQRQGYNTTGSNGGSSQHSSVDQTSRDLQAQEDELRELGIDVVDQVSLERRVEAAVDKAVATHARKQKLQILKKEIKDIRMESKSAENKMLALKNRLTGMQQRVVDPRMYFRVEEDMNSKAQQLKTLREREKFLEQKLASAETNAEELDDLELEEGEILEEEEETQEIDMKDNSEREKLIREGQMTPFGTTSNASKTVSFPRPSKIYTEKHLSVGKKDSTLKSKTEIISCGEMTLFGTILEPADTSNRLSDTQSGAIGKFEQYLQDQFSRQKQHNGSSKDVSCKKSSGDPSYGFPKKRRKKLKEYVGVYDNGNDNHDNLNFSKNQGKAKKSNKKDPLKKHILHPKKRRTEKVSLTVTSTLESDQLKLPPRRLLSEHVSFEGSDSEYSDNQERDSDYFPSDYDCADVIESENDENFESENIGEKRKYILKIRNKKKVEGSDEMSSEDDVPKVKQKNRKSKDDGNIADYMKRVETWKKERLKKKQDKILKGEDLDSEEEEEQGYEQFTGGYKVPLLVWNKLYKYQKTCVRWLWELHSQGCGGILGDEMGLGKTIQIISFLVGLSYSGLSYRRQRWNGLGPTLVVCPATVLHQWVKEFHIWWPPFRVAVLHESGSFTGTRPALISNINSHSGILVTSYTGVRDQLETLLQYDWHYIILDEGHKIRNPEAQITVALKRFQTPHRLILSGSPIQNSLKELWSLFDFVFPGKLGTLPVFLQQFAVPITQGGYANATKLEVQTAFKCASMLRDTINPFLLRRMKNDVRSHLSLPDKNEQVLFCSLSDEQRKIYSEYIAGDQVKAIMGGRAKVFVGLINLRKICNHPDLYTGGPVGENTTWNSGLQPELRYGWWSRSGKMHVLRSILQLWSSQGHRVLLFTQSRQMMCILEKFLMDESYSYLKMDGTTTVASRQPLINKFNSDPSYFVFLLTTRVGGLGVNLTGADRVVIYDPDWNPSTDSQARERAWRIGQLRHVTIYRLLMAGTIEEKIYHRQIFKQFLTNRVLKDPKQQRFFKTNDLYELFSLTEGEKEKTESSAIFAGTGSEIKLGVKKKQSEQSEKKKTDPHRNRETCDKVEVSSLPKGRVFTNNPMSKTQNKSHEKKKSIAMSVENVDKNSAQVGLNQVEKMKELAKLISKKIGSTKKLQDEPIDSIHLDSSHKEEGNTDDKSLDSSLIGEGKDDDKTSSNILPNNDMEVKMSENNVDEEKPGTFAVKDFIISKPSAVENIADMKLVAETETSCTKGLTFTSLSLSCEEVSHHQGKEKRSTKLANVDKCLEKAEEKSKPSGSILFKALSIGNYERERNKAQEMHSDKFEINSDLNTEQIRNSNKHKKKYKDKSKEKHKEHHKKGKKFEGMRIEYLAKKRKYKKTEEEEMEEKELSKSQDQYVLEKLFRKSGIHGALSHDAIMNNSDPDYLLVEGEAERVAKEALKAVRASRARCFRPQPIESKQLSLGKSTLKFGKNKSQIFKEVSYVGGSKMKDGSHKEQKIPMFSGGFEEEIKDNTDVKDGGESKLNTPLCNEQGVGSSGILSSSQLLSRMRQRNKGIALDSENEEEDDYDPDYPSTAPVDEESLEPEIQENIDLLADIRNFVAFQAEIDGQATTQEIISRFQERLPASQTPFFKALLTQICDFHRDNSGRGIWSLKGEFR
ncbi:DNA excision repair protein ERCC-6-like [Scylla paramamosain]|uniref:DNA excision repair protein ERCC-6-like n=1 Tax=Scylla paramamosain TaxID=85552 RepID=UPI0030828CE1